MSAIPKHEHSSPSSFRSDFPLINTLKSADGKPIVYLDSAATAQKPQSVIDLTLDVYRNSYAPVHRSVYQLGEEATLHYEAVREKVRSFLGAASTDEIIFTAGTTDSINIVAHGLGESKILSGDEVVVTVLEHHANFVPWQRLAKLKDAKLITIGLEADGQIDLAHFKQMLSPRTKLVALTHLANAYGLRLPIEEMIAAAHTVGAQVLIDAAQSVAHEQIDVRKMGADYLAFSAHKLYGPSGVGILYGKRELLAKLPPLRTGGNMIARVTLEDTTFADAPAKFEAGTPNIAGVIGFGAAIDYVTKIGFERIKSHEQQLIRQLKSGLQTIPGLQILGPAIDHQALLCFVVDGVHPHDLAQFLDHEGICIRAGHHCAQPLLQYLKIPATTRVSVAIYNEPADIDRLVEAVDRAVRFFA